jgi:hypothetical protein
MPKKTNVSVIRTIPFKGSNQLLNKINQSVDEDGSDQEKLNDLAGFFIPVIADWCCIYFLNCESTFERAAFEPAEVLKSQEVYDWVQNDIPNDEADGLPAVIPARKPIIETDINPIRRGAVAGVKSYMIVPIFSKQQMLGAITLILAESSRHYDKRLLDFNENLSLHIGPHLEKSWAIYENQNLRALPDQPAVRGATELQGTMAQLKYTEEVIQTLFRVSNKLNATLDVELILDTLAQEAIQIVNGENGFAGLRTPEGMSVHRYFQDGVAIPFEYTWQLGEGIPGWVLKYKVTYGSSEAENDPHMSHDLAINANVYSIIYTPILDTVGKVIAFFDIRNKRG